MLRSARTRPPARTVSRPVAHSRTTHLTVLKHLPAPRPSLCARNLSTIMPNISDERRQNMIWAGYTTNQIDNLDETSLRLFDKYSLSKDKKLELAKMGYDDNQLKQIQRSMLTLGSMNEEDDGYGLPSLGFNNLLDLVLKRISSNEIISAEQKKMKAELAQLNSTNNEAAKLNETRLLPKKR